MFNVAYPTNQYFWFGLLLKLHLSTQQQQKEHMEFNWTGEGHTLQQLSLHFSTFIHRHRYMCRKLSKLDLSKIGCFRHYIIRFSRNNNW